MTSNSDMNILYAETEHVLNEMATVAMPYMSLLERNVSPDVFCSLFGLWHCSLMTSDTILKLCQLNKVWDAVILLRSVIHGSAKFAYLLSGDKEILQARFEEYHVTIPKKEFASMEKPTDLLFKIGAYDSAEKESFASKQFRDVIKINKTQEGEGSSVRAVSKKWDFFRLSEALANEDIVWCEMAPDINQAYASANVLVHMNDTGCGEIMQRLAYDQDYQRLMDYGHAANLLFRVSVLQLIRSNALIHYMGGETHTLLNILRERTTYVELLNRINKVVCDTIISHENGGWK